MAGNTQSAGSAARRGRSVFLVDDEPTLLDLAEAALQGLGLTLKKFSTPKDALASLRKARQKPDVLVTDYALGKMNGLELIQQCRKVHPGLKVVMVSGHAVAEIALAAPAQVDRFLAKPYQPEALAELVLGLLAGQS
jgi:two-component system nitrogen regulation response regulator NtrX